MEVRGWFTGQTESGAYLENRKANHGNKQIGIKIFLQSSTTELIDLMIEEKSQLFLLGKIFNEVNKEELVGWRNNYKPISSTNRSDLFSHRKHHILVFSIVEVSSTQLTRE